MASYIKPYLEDLIHDNQKGFLTGRYIGENIQNALAIIEHAKECKLDALLIFLDFQKAIDCVEWDMINVALKKFGFKDKFCNLVRCIYKSNT